jgi:hypothetical protein
VSQQQHVQALLAPIFGGGGQMEVAMQMLHASLEPRVYVAVGRALWDHSGRELHEFVQVRNDEGRFERRRVITQHSTPMNILRALPG